MRTSTLVVLYAAIALTAACATAEPEDPKPLDPALQAELSGWLSQNGDTPENYVIKLLADHDVVFLGEQHRARHDVLFVQSLIKPLYESGVRALATEFGRREDQPLIDALVTAPEWDEDMACRIVFLQFVWWGYREYVDVYRAAWSLNQELSEGEPPFRIIGINDSPDWSFIKTQADRDDPKVKRQAWRGGGEDKWAEAILDVVRSGEKVVVHCGIHHGFTEYRQPIVTKDGFLRFDNSLRCGNHVFNELGKKAVTVFLHAPWNGREGYGSKMRHPADGIIDALMLATGPQSTGFDLNGTPFGDLRIKDAVYCHGYDDFKLGDFCDGWIYTKPISQYEGVTAILDWINETNLEHAQAQSPNPRFRDASAERFNSAINRDAEIPRRWGHLR